MFSVLFWVIPAEIEPEKVLLQRDSSLLRDPRPCRVIYVFCSVFLCFQGGFRKDHGLSGSFSAGFQARSTALRRQPRSVPFPSRDYYWALPSGSVFWALPICSCLGPVRVCSWALPSPAVSGFSLEQCRFSSVQPVRSGSSSVRPIWFGSVGWFSPVRFRKAGLVQFDQSGLIKM